MIVIVPRKCLVSMFCNLHSPPPLPPLSNKQVAKPPTNSSYLTHGRELSRIESPWKTLSPFVRAATATSRYSSPTGRSSSSRQRTWRSRPTGWPSSRLDWEEVRSGKSFVKHKQPNPLHTYLELPYYTN